VAISASKIRYVHTRLALAYVCIETSLSAVFGVYLLLFDDHCIDLTLLTHLPVLFIPEIGRHIDVVGTHVLSHQLRQVACVELRVPVIPVVSA